MKSLRNPHRKPTHPGAVLREDVLPELGWTQSELAHDASQLLLMECGFLIVCWRLSRRLRSHWQVLT